MAIPLRALACSLCVCAAAWVGCSGTSATSVGGGDPADAAANADAQSGSDGAVQGDSAISTTDASDDASADGGDGPVANEVTLQWDNCPMVSKCGGDPKGKWAVTGGCVQQAPVVGQCSCSFSNVVVKAKGLVGIDATQIERAIELKTTASLFVDAACKTGAFNTCVALTPVVKQNCKLDDVVCNDAAGGSCNCTTSRTVTIAGKSQYTKAGSVLTLAPSGDTLGFCKGTNELTLEDQTPSRPFDLTLKLGR